MKAVFKILVGTVDTVALRRRILIAGSIKSLMGFRELMVVDFGI